MNANARTHEYTHTHTHTLAAALVFRAKYTFFSGTHGMATKYWSLRSLCQFVNVRYLCMCVCASALSLPCSTCVCPIINRVWPFCVAVLGGRVPSPILPQRGGEEGPKAVCTQCARVHVRTHEHADLRVCKPRCDAAVHCGEGAVHNATGCVCVRACARVCVHVCV